MSIQTSLRLPCIALSSSISAIWLVTPQGKAYHTAPSYMIAQYVFSSIRMVLLPWAFRLVKTATKTTIAKTFKIIIPPIFYFGKYFNVFFSKIIRTLVFCCSSQNMRISRFSIRTIVKFYCGKDCRRCRVAEIHFISVGIVYTPLFTVSLTLEMM